MNKKYSFPLRNLSVISIIAVYILMVILHMVSDGFLLEDQLGLLIIMVPFILNGLALDYILRRNDTMETWLRLIAQLLPLGIFLMQLVSTVLLYQEITSLEIFNYLIWLFLALPLFIVSYQKDGLRSRVMHSLIGTGAMMVIYLYLTTQTDALNKSYGAIIYLFSYFLMLFAASGMKKIAYLEIVLGILDAVILLAFRYFPFTADAKSYGWDYDITAKLELLIIFTLIACILVQVYEARNTAKEK